MNKSPALIPTEIFISAGIPRVKWCLFTDFKWNEPFYNYSLRRSVEKKAPWALTTDLDMLHKEAAKVKNRQVEAIIYHTGRCGSTLLVRCLQTSPARVVISEYSPFDDLLMLQNDGAISDVRPYLRDLVNIYASNLPESVDKIFIKTTLLPVFFLECMRDTFSEAKEIFIVRDPVEVLSSYIKDPPPWLRKKGFLYRRYFDQLCSLKADEKLNFELFPELILKEILNIFEKELLKDRTKFTTYDLLRRRKGHLFKSLGFSEDDPDLKEIYSKYTKDFDRKSIFMPEESKKILFENPDQEARIRTQFINYPQIFSINE